MGKIQLNHNLAGEKKNSESQFVIADFIVTLMSWVFIVLLSVEVFILIKHSTFVLLAFFLHLLQN
jgi:hypothetical protein